MKPHNINNKVLVLNASYEPLNVCEWKRAVLLVFKGKAEQLENSHKKIHTKYKLPTVIRLRTYIKVPHKEIALTRKNLMQRDDYTCQYCHTKEPGLTIDHVTPRSRGGTNNWFNVVACCKKCNVKKGNKLPEEAGMHLLKQPKIPYAHFHFEVSNMAKNVFPSWQKYIIGLSA